MDERLVPIRKITLEQLVEMYPKPQKPMEKKRKKRQQCQT